MIRWYILCLTQSCVRYKKNIEYLKNGSIIDLLKPVLYDEKNPSKNNANNLNSTRYGLIAEDVEKVDKRLVFYNNKSEVEGVEYTDLISLIKLYLTASDLIIEQILFCS